MNSLILCVSVGTGSLASALNSKRRQKQRWRRLVVERAENRQGRLGASFRDASDDRDPDLVAVAGKPLGSSHGIRWLFIKL